MKSTTPIRDLTTAARAGLSGNWGKTIGVMVSYLILLVGVSLIPVAGWLMHLIFTAPLTVGMATYLLMTMRRGCYNPFSLLFSGFDCFGVSLRTALLVALKLVLWMLPLVVLAELGLFFVHRDPAAFPPKTLAALSAILLPLAKISYLMEHTNPLILLATGAVLFLSAVFFMILLQMRYGLALFVVADDPAVRARDAVRRGVELMKGNYWRLGLLWLRFIGWQILCVLTLGIGLIWLAPYFMAATTAFYDDLAKDG
ncbi:MAG: DUF975 family protein [Kiritimatiellales bacterium]